MGNFIPNELVSPVALLWVLCGLGALAVAVMAGLNRYQSVVMAMIASTWIRSFYVVNERVFPSEAESNPGTYMRLAILGLVGAIGVIYFIQMRYTSGTRIPMHFTLMAIFMLYAGISVTYSLDPQFSVARIAEFSAFSAFLLGVHAWVTSADRVQTTLNVLFWTSVIGIFVNLSSLALFPDMIWFYETPSRFQGVMGDPNNLGGFLLMAYPILLLKYRQLQRPGRMFLAPVIAIAVGLHALSGSRSSIGAAFLGLLVWHCALNQKVKAAALAAGAVGVACLIYISPIASFQRDSQSNIADLTGRTGIWEASVGVLKSRPLTGFGYQVNGAILTKVNLDISDWYLNESVSARFTLHNGYLSIAVGNGVLGLVLWCLILAIPIIYAVNMPRSTLKAMLLALMVQALFLNIIEDYILCGPRFTGPLVFWIAWVLAGRFADGYETGSMLYDIEQKAPNHAFAAHHSAR